MSLQAIRRLPTAGLLTVLLGSVCHADEAATRRVVETAVESLVKEDFDAVANTFDDNLAGKLPVAQLKAAWKQVGSAVGEYSKTSPPKQVAKGTYESTVAFSRLALIVRVSVNREGKVAGLFMRPEPLPNPEPSSESPSSAGRPLRLVVNGVTIHGTLLLPSDSSGSAMPLAVLHSGSGPTDRDGNQPMLPNDSLKKLAEELTALGIATFRYDKRGSGATGMTGPESDLKLQTYVEDLVGVVGELSRLPDTRFRGVTLVGHSEGAQICMLAAQKAKVSGVVTIAGSGRNLKELLKSQLQGKLPPDLAERSNEILSELAAGRQVESVPDELMILFRPSVQPFLISCIQSDPTKLAASIQVPMLILQGDEDIQVSVEDAKRLKEAQPEAELEVLKGMNHVLRIVETEQDQQESYRDRGRELTPGLSKRIADFVNK
ncbi:MAG: alpha/beta fold hydrolase [Planctomycetota bacterium]